MAIATSGVPFLLSSGSLRVTCTGGDSLIEINQDNTGWVKLNGGGIVDGVINNGDSFITEDLSSDDSTNLQIRFTGAGVISYTRLK